MATLGQKISPIDYLNALGDIANDFPKKTAQDIWREALMYGASFKNHEQRQLAEIIQKTKTNPNPDLFEKRLTLQNLLEQVTTANQQILADYYPC